MQTIILDDAWSTPEGSHFSGRLTDVRLPARAGSGRGHTLYRTTRLLFTRGEEGAVQWSVGGLRWQTRADDRGYWSLRTNQPLAGLTPGWHDIETQPPTHPDVARAGLLVHDPANAWGLISDIDDTILVSHVLSKRRLLRNSLLLPPEARQAVQGAAALYASWLDRNPNPAATPVFYVSAAPRQLSDSVRRFLGHNGFPRGVLMLKEVYSRQSDPLRDQQAYKVGRIAAIFEACPQVRFTLVGDDGERDPESFAELQARYPASIHEVWIRSVHPRADRARYPGQQWLVVPPAT
jgi:phosphatidate phosphatase APP1